MNLSDWLNRGVGRAAAMALHFKRSPGAISQWRTNGVPRAQMLAVRDYTGGEVTVEEMIPAAPAAGERVPG